MSSKNELVLVTGGAGFIGSHLVEELLNNGLEVIVIDNLSTGRKENIADFINNKCFEFVAGDICDSELMNELVGECDVIYHLAAAVGAPDALTPVGERASLIGESGACLVRVFVDETHQLFAETGASFGIVRYIKHKK